MTKKRKAELVEKYASNLEEVKIVERRYDNARDGVILAVAILLIPVCFVGFSIFAIIQADEASAWYIAAFTIAVAVSFLYLAYLAAEDSFDLEGYVRSAIERHRDKAEKTEGVQLTLDDYVNELAKKS